MTPEDRRLRAGVRSWMDEALLLRSDEFIDCGEVQCTQLAEACADSFGRDEWLEDPMHAVWDVAVEAAGGWEKRRGKGR